MTYPKASEIRDAVDYLRDMRHVGTSAAFSRVAGQLGLSWFEVADMYCDGRLTSAGEFWKRTREQAND